MYVVDLLRHAKVERAPTDGARLTVIAVGCRRDMITTHTQRIPPIFVMRHRRLIDD